MNLQETKRVAAVLISAMMSAVTETDKWDNRWLAKQRILRWGKRALKRGSFEYLKCFSCGGSGKRKDMTVW